ncbi:hopanoid biosynthesis-associated protein HpnK [Nitrospirillum viridazoti]|uniref:PTS cellobiose transporter n=1 Tax=Nitrospirillum viridazoti CBAmc TaxID=1441467 RepID=A0A248JZ70_9PROT|nr:hopanoid biosynthesis-associated protein HpnK [Nitrospirillum amazonense]ASG23771.1 PTS cellobiose transporter [Nitrospirillum amazonense CBAmc]TWB44824.1 hopanoid biosynthesis associated protein HpnK [Nitrospirillum amazonense]
MSVSTPGAAATPSNGGSGRRLIVTADDFGLSAAVNAAVIDAHLNGILTAASLMVAGAAADAAVALAHAQPSLAVGLHVVLVDGKPFLPPERIPDLVGPGGLFRNDLAKVGASIFFRPKVAAQVAAEVEAQFQAFRATGLKLDHVNAHKHYHLHPTVGRILLDAARRHGARAMRVPVEPADVIRAVTPQADLGLHRVTGPWAKLLRAKVRRAGLAAPDQVLGLAWTGAVTVEKLRGALARLPPGITEIYLHPAVSDDVPGGAPGYRYRDELAALLDPEVNALAAAFPRGGFRDLPITLE